MNSRHRVGERGALLRSLTLAAALVFAAVGCSDDRFTEADLPPEAEIAYPGAIELDRNFDEGESGTYVDGSSADRSPSFRIDFEIDGVERSLILDWYATEFEQLGWEVTYRTERTLTARRESDDAAFFGIYVEVPTPQPERYSMWTQRWRPT